MSTPEPPARFEVVQWIDVVHHGGGKWREYRPQSWWSDDHACLCEVVRVVLTGR